MEAQLEASNQHIGKRPCFADMTVDLKPALQSDLENLFDSVMRTPNPLRSSSHLLTVCPEYPVVWLLRLRLVEAGALASDLEKELDLVGRLVTVDTIYYWKYRRSILEKIGATASRRELDFTAKIIRNNAKNYYAWSHRQWILKVLEGNKNWWKLEEELAFCNKILKEDVCNAFAWNQRLFVVRCCTEEKLEELKDGETVYAIGAIRHEPDNEYPWIYIRILHYDNMAPLCYDQLDFYVDVLQEERFRVAALKESPKSDEDIFMNRTGCVHALNLISELLNRGYKPDRDLQYVITRLRPGSESLNHKVWSMIRSLDWNADWRGSLNESLNEEENRVFLGQIKNIKELINEASESRTSL